MSGGQAIVDALVRHGVDTVFGIPGVQLDPLFDALYDAQNSIRVIHTRHEQGAGYMALGYAQATGRVGTAIVVPGPGLLNASAALSTGYALNSRMLCIVGQIPSKLIGKGTGQLHELPDQLAIARGLTKSAARIDTAAGAPVAMADAFQKLNTGRPRPVEVEMALDVMKAVEHVIPVDPPEVWPNAEPDLGQVDIAAKILGEAANPLIFAGGGAVDAGSELKVLAELLQAPVVMSRSALGVLDSRHPLALTPPHAHRLWRDADVVLGVGTRLVPMIPTWGTDDSLKMIRLDIDAEEMTRSSVPDVAIEADATLGLAALCDVVPEHNRKRADRTAEMIALKAALQIEFDKLDPQMPILRAIRNALPEDGIFVEELTQPGYVARLAFPVYQPRTFINPGYQGTLGYACPTAMGAKVAMPDRKVLAISGDGGFMFNVQELATAAQHGIDVVLVVFNDGAYGNVKRFQQQMFDGKEIAVELRNPDFMKMADAFGIRGRRVKTPAGLERAINEAFAASGPALIEYPLGEVPDPWHLIFQGKAR
ncbi:MAG: thiamine pyrophosphate-dependent enzyme [Pseudomonadota bacterium]|nr:thiamine pyrophosphate-dependent enzyme [Pseudomonadota bacterium]